MVWVPAAIVFKQPIEIGLKILFPQSRTSKSQCWVATSKFQSGADWIMIEHFQVWEYKYNTAIATHTVSVSLDIVRVMIE